MANVATRNLTTYDFYKSAALALMVVDHLGYYFFPEDSWFRVFGRLCVPIWFFLIGYARSRDIGVGMWAGMIVLEAADVLVGMPLLSLNVIASMLLIRLTIDPIMQFAAKRQRNFWMVMGVATALAPFTFPFWEYGTEGYVMAALGYILRHQQKKADEDDLFIEKLLTFSIGSFLALQWSIFGFDGAQMAVLAVGTFTVTIALYFFRPAELPRVTAATPWPVAALIRLGGRHTLLFYVVHLLVFKALLVWIDPSRVDPLHFHLFQPPQH